MQSYKYDYRKDMMRHVIEEHKILNTIHRLSLDKSVAFVSYRLPFQERVKTLLQWRSEPARISDLKSIHGKDGFLFAPYSINPQTPARLIVPDVILTGDEPEESVKLINLLSAIPEKHEFLSDQVETKKSINPQDYIKQVERTKAIINEKKLSKMVLSRISVDPILDNFNPSEFFNFIHQAYPEAFVYMLHIRDAGLWFGASPEPLLHVSGNTASTVSLAGTRGFLSYSDELSWNNKERQEQLIVTDYIEQVLNKFGVWNYSITGPQTYKAGSVEHLKTEFNFAIDDLGSRIFEFIDELHPTPSVCGLPKALALEYIKQTEMHSREYYTGFLGPVNFQGELSLFVNLRCLKAEKENLVYYLGAGITAGSDPEKEWEETESKKNTLQVIVQQLNSI